MASARIAGVWGEERNPADVIALNSRNMNIDIEWKRERVFLIVEAEKVISCYAMRK